MHFLDNMWIVLAEFLFIIGLIVILVIKIGSTINK